MIASIEVRRDPGRPTAVVRRFGVRFDELGDVIGRGLSEVRQFLVRIDPALGRGLNVVVYVDRLDEIEVGILLNEPVVGEGAIEGSSLPEGPVVVAEHVGPYDQIRNVHPRVVEWCGERGHKLVGPCWEIYDHMRGGNDEPRVEIVHRIEPHGEEPR